MFARVGAVTELRSRMRSTDLGAALGAYEALMEVSRSDIRYVQEAAAEALGACAVGPNLKDCTSGPPRTVTFPSHEPSASPDHHSPSG